MRSYPWGTAEALRSKHSDVLALRRLLFELSFDSLKRRTDDRYYQFRAEQLNAASQAAAGVDLLSQESLLIQRMQLFLGASQTFDILSTISYRLTRHLIG